MWLGPAPFVPYDPHRCLYHFRWFWDYSGGQTTNLLAHEIDVVQWCDGSAAPARRPRWAAATRFTGIGETPDVFEAIFEYPGFLATWSQSRGGRGQRRRGLEFSRHEGPAEARPAPASRSSRTSCSRRKTRSRGSPRPRLRRTRRPSGRTALKEEGFDQVRDQFVPHVRNFIDCVKSRALPASDLASSHSDRHPCHLANVAMKVGRVLRWDERQGRRRRRPRGCRSS